ncbi:type I-E CRISPR-associated protein Cas5/CasD [Actinacidiphila acididurans]|uniref:Type I-E CRISPR-associated protein Cas5/CasD n=1 Tax=Actinacidiphila acididurans TaxID=2784346 RepID=A0ABS2TZR9_9ACTN|nr:type I-E CRISPR-associated protein Cas5/CasD [Actinacidiphila acididurans]MBM9507986.1 type I-E CRISPR-associated protein Cas5/CasD [Actinacidiphila acididurans]
MTGFLLHLAAPLQSWGEHSAFTHRDTAAHPTRSGLIGLLASALGIPRAEAVADGANGEALFARLTRVRFTVRVDRPGTVMGDFHTVGGGYPQHLTVPTAKGARRGADAATIVSTRHYLSDAAFTVAADFTDGDLAQRCADAVAAPRWPLHLGRRSCPPGGLLLLRAGLDDPAAELSRVPLARRPPYTTPPSGTVDIRFTSDQPFPDVEADTAAAAGPVHLGGSSAPVTVTTLNDEPVRLTARDRVHRARLAHSTTRPLPVDLCKGYGTAYLDAIADYLHPQGATP